MKLWVEQNWSTWEEESSVWLTDDRRAQIQIEWIPRAEGRDRENVRRGSLRRPSIIDSVFTGNPKISPEGSSLL